eukprot:m.103021 g.103021  ORF g.103021 m.103021 type:complete len:522 (+) comp27460_c0_seq3:347-1912(+)
MPYNVTIREPPVGIDTSLYTTSPFSSRYSNAEFEGTNQDYYIGILTSRGAIVLGVALILFLHISIWNCCSLCCKGRKLSKCMKLFITFLLLAFTLGGVVCLSLLLQNGDDQNDLVGKVVPSLDYLAWGFDDTVLTVERAVLQSADCSLAINQSFAATQSVIAQANISDYYDFGDINSTYDQTTEAFSALTSNLDDVMSNFNSTDLFFREAAAESIESVNNIRKTAFLGLILFVLIISLLQIIVSFMNMWAKPSLQPRTCCCALLPLTTFLYLLAFIIVWILATVLLVTTTVVADFCVNPDVALYDLTNSVGGDGGGGLNTTLDFYIQCDDTTKNVTNPLKDELDTIYTELQKGKTSLNDFVNTSNICNYVNFTLFGVDCSPIEVANQNMVTQCGLVADYIADKVTPTSPYTEGTVFGQTECATVNSRYQMVLHLVCDDLLSVIANAFQVFLSLGVLMYFIEISRKYSRGRKKRDDDEEEGGGRNKVQPFHQSQDQQNRGMGKDDVEYDRKAQEELEMDELQ